MSTFSDKLRLKEKVDEDLYFAGKDKELVDALHERHAVRAGTRVRVVRRIVSGGQTGVDRAALDAALALGIAVGGWCPKGRRAEDGCIGRRYGLTETPARRYSQRTEWNVRDSDSTLILFRGELSGGTQLTAQLAKRYSRVHRLYDLERESSPALLREWLERGGIEVLNVAGPRESSAPGIYDQALDLLTAMLE